MECLGDSVCRIMSSVNKDSFIFFLSNLDAFNFTCIIAVSSTILESSDESSQSCLVTDLRGKALSFTVDVYGVSVGFSWMPFIVLRKFPSIPGLLNILSWNSVAFLSSVLYAFVEVTMYFFPFVLLTGSITLITFLIEPSLHTQNKSHLVMIYNPFVCCWISVW